MEYSISRVAFRQLFYIIAARFVNFAERLDNLFFSCYHLKVISNK